MALSHAPVSAKMSCLIEPIFMGKYKRVCLSFRGIVADSCLTSCVSGVVTGFVGLT